MSIVLKYEQTVFIIENAQFLSDYYESSYIQKYLCDIQYNHPEIYPLYLILNSDMTKECLNTYIYKATGLLRFKGCEMLAGKNYKCIVESWMINTLKQYKEERNVCLVNEDGEITMEEIKDIKDQTTEESLTTFKIGFNEKEEEERKKIAGPFHTGLENLKIEEDVEDDINDDEGENF